MGASGIFPIGKRAAYYPNSSTPRNRFLHGAGNRLGKRRGGAPRGGRNRCRLGIAHRVGKSAGDLFGVRRALAAVEGRKLLRPAPRAVLGLAYNVPGRFPLGGRQRRRRRTTRRAKHQSSTVVVAVVVFRISPRKLASPQTAGVGVAAPLPDALPLAPTARHSLATPRRTRGWMKPDGGRTCGEPLAQGAEHGQAAVARATLAVWGITPALDTPDGSAPASRSARDGAAW
jgi:hypothetical protein